MAFKLNYESISRIGATVISALATLVVFPPQISSSGTGIIFKGLVTFCASGFFILMYDKFKERLIVRSRAFLLLGVLVLLSLGYEMLFVKFSIDCSIGNEKHSERVVISEAAVKPKLQPALNNWKHYRPSENPILNLLKANDCSPVNIWEQKYLYWRYYSMVFVYFLILADFTTILVFLSEYLKRTNNLT